MQLVTAKFLASMCVILLLLTLTLLYPLTLTLFADPDLGPVYASYAGLLLLGAALTAMGIAVSAATSNQVVAATISLGLFLLLWMMHTLGALLPPPFDNIAVNVSLLTHFTPFATGAPYLSDVGYFITVTLLGLLLGVRALGWR